MIVDDEDLHDGLRLCAAQNAQTTLGKTAAPRTCQF
jgi:hypothetical protein